MQKYTNTLCTTQWQMNLTTSLLQDIPTFDGWDTTKLEDWLSDIEMATDILKESWAYLAEAQSSILTHTLIHEALQAGKCLDDIRDILHLKLCNANIHNYMSHFMEIQQKNNETLAAYIHWFKTEAKRSDFNSDTTAICIFVRSLWNAHSITAKNYKKDPQTLLETIKLVEKLNVAQVTVTLTSPTVNMMLKYDRCFVSSKSGHIGYHCLDA